MAKSTQSTLRSSRLQMVPREGMVSAGWGQMGLEETEFPGSIPFPPLFSPCLRTLGRSIAVRMRDFDLGWQLLNREALLTPVRGAPSAPSPR